MEDGRKYITLNRIARLLKQWKFRMNKQQQYYTDWQWKKLLSKTNVLV